MKRQIRILVLTQYYPPEIGAPQSRLANLTRELTKLGFEVVVLTAMPNYPTGKLFPGYYGCYRKETVDGILVYRSHIFPTQSPELLRRLINYFSFVHSSFWMGLMLPRPDFLYTESPPLFLGISGYLLSRIKHSKWIFNVADLWPASIVELGLISSNSWLNKFSKKMEAFFYRKAWLVSGQSKSILSNINNRFPDIKTYLLSNGVDLTLFGKNINRVKQNQSEKNTVRGVYAGLHGLAQGLDRVIQAIDHLASKKDFEFIFVGDGPQKKMLINLQKNLRLTNVKFFDPIPHSEIPTLLAKADFCLVPLKKQLTGAVPSKLYEAMASSKPVILIAEGEAAEIVKKYNCGLVVKPGDIKGLSEAINYLAKHPEERVSMGVAGRKAAKKYFDRQEIIQRFSRFLQNAKIT